MLSWLPAHDDPPCNIVVWARALSGSRLVVVNEVFAKLEAETVSGLPLVGGLSGTALVAEKQWQLETLISGFFGV